MKKLIILTTFAALSFSAPAHAQLLNSGNSGLLGLANNLMSVQTGHISVLNGGILNGSSVLSGIGLGNTVISGQGSTVVPGNSGTIVQGHGHTVTQGTGNAVGNSVTSTSNSFNRSKSLFGW